MSGRWRQHSSQITGTVLWISVSTKTSVLASRMEILPMSRTLAPADTCSSEFRTASPNVKEIPPSKNKSGVQFTMDIR
ncbi:hypothetical protein PTTG_10057 [Puccinia triticina 1-1 BBBD Race 1]|uniref:Uncharacterized protein n=1 Tax=Puccinia triticina (isolate 1-1 / race 1 (BBBD)) TaxID=630390 RepID=A0A0C4FA17_PUCT1|nr:hypothetical protein PTTG_10057 [Puccinia triticina 1-1 BBBD Race 1]